MPFVDLQPVRAARSTGITISRSDRHGVIVSVSGAARAALALKPGDRVRIQHDADPAMPRLRIMADEDGKFTATLSPGSAKNGDRPESALMIRMGRLVALVGEPAKGLDCHWETASVPGSIDIDLPREFRATTSHHVPASNNRENRVTLPGRAPAERVKERV